MLRWELERLPHECICKAKQNIDHILTCKTRRFVTLRHNETVNVTADMLSVVCKDVRKEPTLSTLPDSNDELQPDISVRSFWQRFQRTNVDVRVFYHFTPIYRNQSLATTMKTTEDQKKRKYKQWIVDGENDSFTPLVFTTNGGMSTETKQFYSSTTLWCGSFLKKTSKKSTCAITIKIIFAFANQIFL